MEAGMAHFQNEGFKKMTLVVSAPVATIEKSAVRMVQAISLRGAPAGKRFYVELHDEKGTIRNVMSFSFNTTKPIKAWDADEGMTVAIEGRGMVFFGCHTMGGPKYPVAKIIGPRGTPRNVRVTFYTDIEQEPAEAHQPAPAVETVTPQIIDVEASPVQLLTAPAAVPTVTDFPKLNRADFSSQGEFLQACKKRKAAMREAGVAE
ncbi:MAG: hypothetical protein [Caudoviricetes sp.]|nr:MAG: hypothetical protein [Caudoviricetes sp.]